MITEVVQNLLPKRLGKDFSVHRTVCRGRKRDRGGVVRVENFDDEPAVF